ncbi:MAG: superoxide dismutase family protein [Actinomycetota bacterium]
MSAIPRFAVAALAASVGAIAVIAPAAADPDHLRRADGPTNVYDAAFANVETDIRIVNTNDGRTTVTLRASRFPESAYGKTLGAHVHIGACGADPLAALGHYQHPDTVGQPLHQREIWLDLDVNDKGKAKANAVVPWTVVGPAASVMIHALPTNPETGAAGARLICTSGPISSAP